MKKANLLCPKEKVFFKGLLVLRPRIPTEETRPEEAKIPVEVDILEESGDKAIILLPNLLMQGEQRTATVNIQYLT